MNSSASELVGKFHVVKNVLLTPKSEDAGWTVRYERDDQWSPSDYHFDEGTRFSGGDLVFDAMSWGWKVTYARSEKFDKVVRVLGDVSLAEEVMTALEAR